MQLRGHKRWTSESGDDKHDLSAGCGFEASNDGWINYLALLDRDPLAVAARLRAYAAGLEEEA